MISTVLFIVWLCSISIPIALAEDEIYYPWAIWTLLSVIWIIPVFTGIEVKNNEGSYTGYVTAVEQNGAIFKGWNVYLKTELDSSNEDIACINRENQELIERLKKAQEKKENITVEYEGVWQYKIGKCPNTNWMVINII